MTTPSNKPKRKIMVLGNSTEMKSVAEVMKDAGAVHLTEAVHEVPEINVDMAAAEANLFAKMIAVHTIVSSAKLLHTKCEPITEITPYIKSIASMMEFFLQVHALDDPTPVAISAPQLGYSLRMFSYVKGATREIFTVINPEIIYIKKMVFSYEGCLSLPKMNYKLKRGNIVKLKGLDVHGYTKTHKGHDLLAHIFLHELDHLNGITIDMVGQKT